MNILSATNALKEIKLNELDDEFQIAIMNTLNQALPDGVTISGENTGAVIRKVIDTELPTTARRLLMQSAIFDQPNDIVRFYNNVEKVQEAHAQAMIYDDAVKGNFISSLAMLTIFVVAIMMTVYVITEDTRGKVADSRVGSLARTVVDTLAKPIETSPKE